MPLDTVLPDLVKQSGSGIEKLKCSRAHTHTEDGGGEGDVRAAW